jgi:hypothetical protein
MKMNRCKGVSRHGSLVFLLILAGLFPAGGWAQQTARNPLEAIGWLVGKWRAAEQGTDGTPVAVELDAKWAPGKQALVVTCTRTPSGGTPVLQYRATFTWDSAKKSILMTQNDANGDRFEGQVFTAGNDFDISGRVRRANGSTQDLVYTFNFWSPGTFDIETSGTSRQGDATSVNLPLVFLRQQSSPGGATGAPTDVSDRITTSEEPPMTSMAADGR